MLRLIASRVPRSSNLLVSTVAPRRTTLITTEYQRTLTTSAPRYASVSDDQGNDNIPEKLKGSPDAMKKVANFMSLLQKKGVDLQHGKLPGMMQVAKLAMDGEVRAATMEVTAALKEAGINIEPSEMARLMHDWNSGKKDGSEK